MTSQRLSGTHLDASSRTPVLEKTQPSVDMLKLRLLIQLNEEFDAARLQRMPATLVRETARRQLQQSLDAQSPPMPPVERDRFIDEIIGEAFGFGPLDELFADPAVSEIAILGPYAVIARNGEEWLSTKVKFRDIEHVREILDKVRAQGEAIGDPLPDSMLDVTLSNGFRAIAVLLPESAGTSPTAAFVRE